MYIPSFPLIEIAETTRALKCKTLGGIHMQALDAFCHIASGTTTHITYYVLVSRKMILCNT